MTKSKVLLVMGQYQYGDKSRGYGTEYLAFNEAFKNLGYEVFNFDSWSTELTNYRHLNENLVDSIKSIKPNIIFVVTLRCEIWIETLQFIRSFSNALLINWTTDDSWKYSHSSKFIGRYYDLITTTYSSCVGKYLKDKIRGVILTQWAARTSLLKPPIQATSCKYGVTFIGAAHGDRRDKINFLIKNGINVDCFGHGWERGSIPASKIPLIMRNSIISLNFSNSVSSNQVKARVFEVCGAGGFLLTEDAPHLDEIYDVGSEIDIFKSKFEMLEKVRHYLSESSQRDKMAHLSYVRTLSQHTYESRIRMVLSTPFEKSKDMAIDSTDWVAACQKYKSNAATKFLKSVILIPLQFFLGEDRGFRAARKIVFSLSIFLFGEKTFSSASWVGIVFPGRG